jgi:hypothetical protein
MKLTLSVCYGAPQDQTVNAHCFPLVTLHDSAHAYVAIHIIDLVTRCRALIIFLTMVLTTPQKHRNVSEGSSFARLNPSRKW